MVLNREDLSEDSTLDIMPRWMVLCLIILLIPACQDRSSDEAYISFLRKQSISAKDFVLDLFKEYDIVILCERNHKEFTQYELFMDIVGDPYFIDSVGHVFTEVGVSNLDTAINIFLHSEFRDSATLRREVTSIFRDIDSAPYWHCYSYPWFLTQLSTLNQGLNDRKVSLHPLSVAFEWSKCTDADQYRSFDQSIVNRDSLMAENFMGVFDRLNAGTNTSRKALVILNYKHAFLQDHRFLGEITHNTGRYLANRYGDRVASVYIMGLAIPEAGHCTIVKDGKWDHYFEALNRLDVEFKLKNIPFGRADFDVIPPDSLQDFKYQDQFTGLIYYHPVEERYFRTGWEDFVTDEFRSEFERRMIIFSDAMELDLSKEEINNHAAINSREDMQEYGNTSELREKIDRWKREDERPGHE